VRRAQFVELQGDRGGMGERKGKTRVRPEVWQLTVGEEPQRGGAGEKPPP